MSKRGAPQKYPLTETQQEEFKKLRGRQITYAECARRMGVKEHILHYRARSLGLVARMTEPLCQIDLGAFRIKRRIPIPPESARCYKRKGQYPFPKMKVGDMFEAPGSAQTTLISASQNFAKRHGLPWRFVTRTLKPGVVGIWRVE